MFKKIKPICFLLVSLFFRPVSSMNLVPEDSNSGKISLINTKNIKLFFTEALNHPFLKNDGPFKCNYEKLLSCIKDIISSLQDPTQCKVFASYFSGTLKYEFIILYVLLKMGFPIETIIIAEPDISPGFYDKNSIEPTTFSQNQTSDAVFLAFRKEFLDQKIFVFEDHLNHKNICRFHKEFLADIVFMAHPIHGYEAKISNLIVGGSLLPESNNPASNCDYIDFFKAPSIYDTKPKAPIIIYYDCKIYPYSILTLEEWELTATARSLLYSYTRLPKMVKEIEGYVISLASPILTANQLDYDNQQKCFTYVKKQAFLIIDTLIHCEQKKGIILNNDDLNSINALKQRINCMTF